VRGPPELGLVSLLGAVFEDSGELHIIEHSVLDRGLSVHFVHILLCKPVSDGSEEFTQSVLVDDSRLVLVEAPERVPDDLLRVGALQSLSEQSQEHGEINGAWSFVHHALEVILRRILAE